MDLDGRAIEVTRDLLRGQWIFIALSSTSCVHLLSLVKVALIIGAIHELRCIENRGVDDLLAEVLFQFHSFEIVFLVLIGNGRFR